MVSRILSPFLNIKSIIINHNFKSSMIKTVYSQMYNLAFTYFRRGEPDN